MDERVEDGGHEEVGNASTGISKTAGEGIGCADDIFVEEARGPDLTWDEATTEDSDEESES